MFLTIILGSQVDHNVIQFVSQILLILLFEITQKKLQLKHFTITKPLFYLELRGKIVRLPGKLCQTGVSSRKWDFLAFLEKSSLICSYGVCLGKMSTKTLHARTEYCGDQVELAVSPEAISGSAGSLSFRFDARLVRASFNFC